MKIPKILLLVLFCLASQVAVFAQASSALVTTLAGSGSSGYADGNGSVASFSAPAGVAVDGVGNVYVADSSNNRIRKITPSGIVSTLAGSGSSGYADGNGTSAEFNSPWGVAVDGSGNVYVADSSNHRIRKITATGTVTTLAGSGSAAFANGQRTSASFNSPLGVAVDGSGNVYVADLGNHRIRKIDVQGNVTTLAGSGAEGAIDAQGTSASFACPRGVAVDGSGNVYVGDWDTERIRKIDASGNVTTLAGSGGFGFADGQGTSAIFARPNGVAVDGSGNVYVADHNNHRIRQIDVQGNVTTLAGSGDWAFADGQGTSASFGGPIGVAVDGSGNVYVGDYYNNRIRKIETLSSPTPSDSDGDGVNDYREEKDGTNPNNSSFFNPLSKGLVAYYPFNGNANDESGNGKAATLSANSTFQSGFSSRQALKIVGNGSFFRENTAEFPSLDKSNAGQFVEIPEPNLINPHIFSSSIWVNEEGMTNSDGESFITAGYGPKSMPLIANYYLINENSSLSSQTKLTDSNPGPDLQTSVKLDTIQNVWTNYMVVCNGIDLTVYKNGIKIHSGNVFGKPQGNWSIGRHWWDNGDTFSTRFIGLVADCRIYNRALTAAEVLQLYSEESGEPNMVTVQGGTLPTGSALAGQVVGHFQIGKYEVTWGEWKAVRDWAVANGYTDLANIGEGSGDDHPVRNVNWFDVVKWCNAKSEKEGLNPVYFSSNSIFRTGKFWNFESGVISMRFNANGYRLPLEKEWEWAARGAILSQGYTYSGGNNLEAVGWYSGNSKNAEVGLHQVSGSIIRFSTILGEFDVELFNESTPNTVENFLGYLRRGDYNNSIIHRSVPGFVIQGGGFRLEENSILPIPTVPPVLDEPIHPNFRGTIAMAKIGGTLNSATNQWFINLSNNSPNLDYQSGGFTVFGEVVGTGMTVVDNISGLEVINASTQLGSAFGSLPLLQQELLASNLVLINKVEEISLPIFAGTWPVGKKLPNELGIHDMSGNLWEWCWEAIDWNELGYARRIRGGSWSGSAEGCQNSFRITGGPHSTNDRYTTNGFRLARNASGSIQPATPVITTLPVASGINFGQSLSNSTLTGGVASVNGTTVAGSFAFASPSTVPPVGNSTHSVVFTPNDSVNYTTATANVTVSVSKAGAVISTLPSASSITFGQALSSSVLTGGAANVAGSFAFASPSTKPGAGNSTQGVVFTPTDSGNYTTATANVTVRVLQAVPEVSVWPTASPLKFGQALSASVLSGGSAGVAGAFGFVNPSTIPPLGLTTQAVRFTPADSGNYTTLSSNVTVTVDKAGPVISSLPTASAITEGQSLAASVLTGGSANVAGSFAFAVPGTVPAVGNSTHGVVFSPVDAGNYTVAAGNVTVRVNALPSFSLNTTSTPGGNVTASAAGPHKQGSTVTLTAVPDSGFVFVRWAGNATGTVNPLSLTVGGNLSVVAIFSQAEPADTNVQEFTGGSLLGVGPSGSVAGGANGVAATPDGGMVSVGDFTGTFQALGQNHTAGVNNRSFAIKHSANGTIQWAVSTGASGALVKNERVAVDAAGNIFVAGIFTGTVNFGPATLTAKGNTNADIFVAKLHSSNGTVQWVASGGGTNSETLNGLLAGADGEAYVTGGYFGANATFGSLALAAQTGGNSNRDAYLGRISSNGTWQWVVAAGGSSTDQGRAVAVRDAGSLWWGGNFQGSAAVGPQQLTSQGATDIFVAAVDAASGNTTSPIRFGGTGEDALTALVSDRGEGFYASGSFASDMALGSVSLANSGVGDGFVARWQKNAGWTWGVALQGGDDDLATSLAMDAEGRLYAGGYFASESLTAASSTLNNTELFSYDGFVARFTSVGGVKWLRGLRGDYNDYVRGVACVSAGASTGALHLVGYTESALSGDAVSLQAPKGSGDAFFVRMNPASAAPSRTVTVNPSVGGMVTLSPAGPSYPLGTQVTLTPLPAAGFGFVRWGGSASGNATPLTITVNQSVSIDAEFADIGAPLVTVNSPAEGMQLPSAKVDFTGVVTDNVGVVSAAWGLNGVEKGNLTLTQNGSFSVPAVPLVPGDNLFTVVAVDAAGNEAVEEVLLVWSPSRVFSLPATVSVNEGRTLKIPVRLTSEGGVGGFRLQVNFDPAVFSSANFSFTGQAALGESLWTAPSPGRVVLLTSLGGGSISSGIQQIGELTLRVRSVPLGGLANAIGVEVLDVSNNLGNPLLDGTGSSGCTVNVRSRSLPADINGNGFVDSGDGALLKTLIAEQDPERPWDVALNDLNATGSLDTGDLTKLLRIVVGFDPKPSPLVQPKAIRTTSMRTMSFAAMSLAPSIPAFFQNNGTRTPVEVRVSGNLDGQTLLAEVVLPPMGSALNSLEFELQYPANLLQIAEAQAGEAAPLNAQVNPAFGNSTIRFAAFNNSPWAATGGTVLRVTFTRNSGAPAGSARHLITLENLLAFTGGGSDSLEVFQRPAALGRQMQNWLGEVVSNAPADADSDGDGMTNRQEFLAGTDPNDRGSLLQLDGFLHDPAKGEQTLTWRAKRGVRYRVQSSENLSLWTTDNSTELLGNDGDVSLSIKPVGSKTKLFYRLQVVE